MPRIDDPKFSTLKNFFYSLLWVIAGTWLITKRYTDIPLQKEDIHVFAGTISSQPEYSGRYNKYFTFDIIESEFTISYSKDKIPSNYRNKLDRILKPGDKVQIGLLKEDYENNVLNNYSRSWYKGQHIAAITLSKNETTIVNLKSLENHEQRESLIGFVLGIHTILWVLIVASLRISIMRVGQKYYFIIVVSYLLLIYILYQVY